MYKTGLSTCGRKVTAELCEGYKKAGIEVLEVCYGIELWTCHLPFDPYDICERIKDLGMWP